MAPCLSLHARPMRVSASRAGRALPSRTHLAGHQHSRLRALQCGRRGATLRKASLRCVAEGASEEDAAEKLKKEEERKREEERLKMLSQPAMPPTSGGRFKKLKKDGPDDFGAAGSTRGGEYGLGPQTDKALNAAGNADAMLIAGAAVLVLFGVLVYLGPPPPAPSSLY